MKKFILITLSILFSSLFLQAQQIEKSNEITGKIARYTNGYVGFYNSTNEILDFELVNVYGGTENVYRINPGRSVSGIAISSGMYDVHVHPASGKEYRYRIEDGYGVLSDYYTWGLCYTFELGSNYNVFYVTVSE